MMCGAKSSSPCRRTFSLIPNQRALSTASSRAVHNLVPMLVIEVINLCLVWVVNLVKQAAHVPDIVTDTFTAALFAVLQLSLAHAT